MRDDAQAQAQLHTADWELLHRLVWLLGRGGQLSMPWQSEDGTHLRYDLGGVSFSSHGTTLEIAAESLYSFVREHDASNLPVTP